VEVSYGTSGYQLHKRYRDFAELHEQLAAIEFLLMESALPKVCAV